MKVTVSILLSAFILMASSCLSGAEGETRSIYEPPDGDEIKCAVPADTGLMNVNNTIDSPVLSDVPR